MKKRLPYNIDDGYFEKMQQELLDIPYRQSLKDKIFNWRVATSAVTAIATVTLIVIVTRHFSSDSYTDDDVLRAALQTEQIEEYLADSGISIYQLTEYIEP